MKVLRYSFLLFAMAFITNTASAQFMLGPGVVYGTGVEEIGIQARGVLSFNDTWRGQADFTYYLISGDGLSFWEINANANYVFSNTGAALFYALGGLNFTNASVDLGPFGNVSSSDVGFNIGAGTNVALGSGGTMFFGEAKYVLSGGDQLVLAVGILFGL